MGRSILECGGILGIAQISDVGSESPITSSYSFTDSVEMQWTVVVSCPVLLSAFCILHSVHPVSCRLVIPPIFYSLQYRISQIHWICITHPSLSLHVCIEYGDAWQFNNSIPFTSHGCHYLCFCLSACLYLKMSVVMFLLQPTTLSLTKCPSLYQKCLAELVSASPSPLSSFPHFLVCLPPCMPVAAFLPSPSP